MTIEAPHADAPEKRHYLDVLQQPGKIEIENIFKRNNRIEITDFIESGRSTIHVLKSFLTEQDDAKIFDQTASPPLAMYITTHLRSDFSKAQTNRDRVACNTYLQKQIDYLIAELDYLDALRHGKVMTFRIPVTHQQRAHTPETGYRYVVANFRDKLLSIFGK